MTTHTVSSSKKIFHNNESNNHEKTKILGFWVYLMSDCILFATLFATYFVLKDNVANGPSGKEIFEIPLVFLETIILLSSSMTCSIASFSIKKNNKIKTNIWLFITVILGIIFINIEISEFYSLICKNYGPDRSAFLSIFFTIVGTHGVHVISGIIWMIVIMIQIYFYGCDKINKIRLKLLSLFWYFLEIIWIFVFNVIYLLGIIK